MISYHIYWEYIANITKFVWERSPNPHCIKFLRPDSTLQCALLKTLLETAPPEKVFRMRLQVFRRLTGGALRSRGPGRYQEAIYRNQLNIQFWAQTSFAYQVCRFTGRPSELRYAAQYPDFHIHAYIHVESSKRDTQDRTAVRS
jgi:hypothetical protein